MPLPPEAFPRSITRTYATSTDLVLLSITRLSLLSSTSCVSWF